MQNIRQGQQIDSEIEDKILEFSDVSGEELSRRRISVCQYIL